MNSRFLNWYTQAFGATLGILVCIFAYVNGWMFVYGNINHNFDNMHVNGILSSYLLLPLCIMTLCSSFTKLYEDKCIFNIPLYRINTFICILTTIIGIIGTNLYFVIPTCFIFEDRIFTYIKTIISKRSGGELYPGHTFCESDFVTESACDTPNDSDYSTKAYSKPSKVHIKSLETKKDMALSLLAKNADEQFINEVTGLTIKEIDELKRSLDERKI